MAPSKKAKAAAKQIRAPRFVWTPSKELLMLQTVENQQKEGYRADSGSKPSVIQAIIEALATIDTSPVPSQVETKINTFKKDLKNWLKLVNEMSGFGKDPETGAVIASEEQWNILLAVPVNKEVYGKFRNKPLANEELLSALFLDSLAVEANARTPRDIALNVDAEQDEDASDEKDKEEEESLNNRLAVELEQAQTELNQEGALEISLHGQPTSTSSTPVASSRPSLSTSSSVASLKRAAANQNISRSSRKKAKLTG